MEAVCQYPLPTADYVPEIEMPAVEPNHSQAVVLKGTLGFIAHRLGVPPWGQVLVATLVVVLGAGYLRVSKMDDHLSEINTKLATLPLAISNTLLSQATSDLKLGKVDHAIRATEAAKAILAKASVDKIPAPSGYFEETLSELNTMGAIAKDDSFVQTIHGARLLLAEYRSALEPPPRKRGQTRTIEGSVMASAIPTDNETTLRFVGEPNTELVRNDKGSFTLSDLNIVAEHGGYIVLDGNHFDNVSFVGVTVKYYGGALDLNYARFINCTFESSTTSNGTRLLDYVTLAQNKLSTHS